jgi:hypothetical protein
MDTDWENSGEGGENGGGAGTEGIDVASALCGDSFEPQARLYDLSDGIRALTWPERLLPD